jgi:hypothetical protein
VDVKAVFLHPTQHDRFYRQGETVEMPKHTFAELSARGLVRAAAEVAAGPERKIKARAK